MKLVTLNSFGLKPVPSVLVDFPKRTNKNSSKQSDSVTLSLGTSKLSLKYIFVRPFSIILACVDLQLFKCTVPKYF